MDVVLKDAKGILDELQAYKGAGAEIREVHPEKTSQFGGPDAGSPVVAGREEGRERGSAALVRREFMLPRCVSKHPSSETQLEENTYAVNVFLKATNPHRLLKS